MATLSIVSAVKVTNTPTKTLIIYHTVFWVDGHSPPVPVSLSQEFWSSN